jgi:hypothetical protein
MAVFLFKRILNMEAIGGACVHKNTKASQCTTIINRHGWDAGEYS